MGADEIAQWRIFINERNRLNHYELIPEHLQYIDEYSIEQAWEMAAAWDRYRGNPEGYYIRAYYAAEARVPHDDMTITLADMYWQYFLGSRPGEFKTFTSAEVLEMLRLCGVTPTIMGEAASQLGDMIGGGIVGGAASFSNRYIPGGSAGSGLGGMGGSRMRGDGTHWNSSLFKDKESIYNQADKHTFSDKHVNDGIMNLGGSKSDILELGIQNIQKASDAGLLNQGTNNILIRVNGQEAVIRAHFVGNELYSFNLYPNITTRNITNVIDFR